MRLWVLAHELAGHAVLGRRTARDARRAGAPSTSAAFRPDPGAIAEQARLARRRATPTRCGDAAGARRSRGAARRGAVTRAAALRAAARRAVAAVVGYIDWMVDAVSVRVIGGDALRIAEAVRRRRVETSADDMFVERLLGIRLGHEQVAAGKAFVAGRRRPGRRARPASPLLARPDALPDPGRDRRPRPVARPPRRRSRPLGADVGGRSGAGRRCAVDGRLTTDGSDAPARAPRRRSSADRASSTSQPPRPTTGSRSGPGS